MSIYNIITVGSLLIFVIGMYNFIFKKGRRSAGLGIALLALVGTAVGASKTMDDEAHKAGFESYSDMQDAEKAGIKDPAVFNAQKAQLKATADAEAKAKTDAAAKADAEAKAKQDAANAEAAAKQAEADAFYAPPPEQVAMIKAVDAAIAGYEGAANDLAKGGVRRQRARAICDAVASPTIKGWTGTVANLSTNGDGLGVLEVKLSDQLTVKTFNNALSDTGSNTLIDPDSPIF